ncbi:hypothetical protein PO587_20710 [Streptomyces gilvifuscus]|uniref:DUF4407 domain-containing protein n=1 Tax=Streptomyces gilvifuscus TaxID=1550617 RepID=A0ABT5FWD4_9ACTN|nr:hypothetical protein [Streptomyces gilvifuscus]MDC2956885.1 hypothetical protein [Streptomyces gilvifuscus]
MLGKFWESIGAKLGEKWLAAALPALLFWTLGAAAYSHGHGTGWIGHRTKCLQGQPVVLQVATLAGGLLVVGVSGQLVERVSHPALRGLQGYWWPWLDPLRRRLTDRQTRKLASSQARFEELAPLIDNGTADAGQEAEYRRLDAELRHNPPRAALHMPTRLGMYLRAAESEAKDKYGLDVVKCWPHLWVVLPEQARGDLTAAYTALLRTVQWLVWAMLALIWACWIPWLPLATLPLTWIIHRFWANPNAATYGDLLRASVDLNRRAMYNALSWPLPATPAAERPSGEALTEYLWRGSDRDDVQFTS